MTKKSEKARKVAKLGASPGSSTAHISSQLSEMSLKQFEPGEISYHLQVTASGRARFLSGYSACAKQALPSSTASKPELEPVASVNAKFICKNNIRSTFWQSMLDASEITGDLALALFDR